MDSKPNDSNPEVTVERDDEILKVLYFFSFILFTWYSIS